MNEDVYNMIADKLLNIIPKEWKEVIFYGQFGNNSYQFEYYVGFGNKEYTKCFDLKGISKIKILLGFNQINEILQNEREDLNSNKLWTNCTLRFNVLNEFKMDYDYTDLTYDNYSYNAVWKYKYLNLMPSKENLIAYEAVNKYISKVAK